MKNELFKKRSFTNAQVLIALLAVCLTTALFVIPMRRAASTPEETSKKEAHEEGEKAEEKAIVLSAEAQKNAGIKLEEVSVRDVQASVTVTGTVQPNDTRVSHIRLLARGRIETVSVRVGDRVAAGDTLLTYDNIELGDLVAQFVAAMSALKQAKTDIEVLRLAEERATKLVQTGALAQAELERRAAEVKNADATINSRQAVVARLQQQLRRFDVTSNEDAQTSRTVVRAPVSGVVIDSKVAVGELKAADEDVFTIADLSTVWVQADVYERDVASIRTGHGVEITFTAYPERVFQGTVAYISDVLDPTTRTAKVRCEVKNPKGELRVGMFGSVSLPTSGKREAITVPLAALQIVEGKQLVFVKEGENRLEPRQVTLGTRASGWAEVKQGLKAGEVVVTEGSFALKSHLLRGQIGSEEDEEKEKK